MASETIELKREDLYEQVWSEPVVKVAQRCGVSGTALWKICTREYMRANR